MRKVFIQEIVDLFKDQIIRVEGDYNDVYVDNLADAEHVNETSLDWVNPVKENKNDIANRSKAHVIVVDEGIMPIPGKILIRVQHPKKILAAIGNQFFVDRPFPGIHPTTIIDSEAQIGRSVHIGPYCVIGKVIIGDECVIDSNVRIFDGVIIGKHCDVKTGAVLGGAGFGFERDAEGNKFRFPQVGGLKIGDYVEIGANTCIDRGALSDTEIGDYTKINNLCHIAHNNKIGRNVTITGCVNISGSNVIEDNVWIAPNSSIRGFVHLGEKCTVGMGAVVTKNIPSGETWVGNPARKLVKQK